jgi:hypothetical protein
METDYFRLSHFYDRRSHTFTTNSESLDAAKRHRIQTIIGAVIHNYSACIQPLYYHAAHAIGLRGRYFAALSTRPQQAPEMITCTPLGRADGPHFSGARSDQNLMVNEDATRHFLSDVTIDGRAQVGSAGCASPICCRLRQSQYALLRWRMLDPSSSVVPENSIRLDSLGKVESSLRHRYYPIQCHQSGEIVSYVATFGFQLPGVVGDPECNATIRAWPA